MSSPTADRRAACLPFAIIGTACVVAGGLVAAVTAHAPTQTASWAAAYLVLVAGVAAIGLGMGQAVLAARPPTRGQVGLQLLGWNLGNAAVIVGTVVTSTLLVDVGGVLLVAVLALLVYGVRGHRADNDTDNDTAAPPATGGWALLAYRALVVLLLVSIPVGLVLAHA